MKRSPIVLVAALVALAVAVSIPGAQPAPVKLGLAAAVSGGSAASGEAIKRGLQIAMDEVNGAACWVAASSSW